MKRWNPQATLQICNELKSELSAVYEDEEYIHELISCIERYCTLSHSIGKLKTESHQLKLSIDKETSISKEEKQKIQAIFKRMARMVPSAEMLNIIQEKSSINTGSFNPLEYTFQAMLAQFFSALTAEETKLIKQWHEMVSQKAQDRQEIVRLSGERINNEKLERRDFISHQQQRLSLALDNLIGEITKTFDDAQIWYEKERNSLNNTLKCKNSAERKRLSAAKALFTAISKRKFAKDLCLEKETTLKNATKEQKHHAEIALRKARKHYVKVCNNVKNCSNALRLQIENSSTSKRRLKLQLQKNPEKPVYLTLAAKLLNVMATNFFNRTSVQKRLERYEERYNTGEEMDEVDFSALGLEGYSEEDAAEILSREISVALYAFSLTNRYRNDVEDIIPLVVKEIAEPVTAFLDEDEAGIIEVTLCDALMNHIVAFTKYDISPPPQSYVNNVNHLLNNYFEMAMGEKNVRQAVKKSKKDLAPLKEAVKTDLQNLHSLVKGKSDIAWQQYTELHTCPSNELKAYMHELDAYHHLNKHLDFCIKQKSDAFKALHNAEHAMVNSLIAMNKDGCRQQDADIYIRRFYKQICSSFTEKHTGEIKRRIAA